MPKSKQGPRKRRDKEHVRRWAIANNRKILWRSAAGEWHASTDRRNTPSYAVEIEEVQS